MHAARPGSTGLQLATLLATAFLLRCDTFGDPNLHADEAFYREVGLAMQHGLMPYVDLWDRKPFGLFAIYYLIGAVSAAPIAYQAVATIFAGATAFVIGRIAALWAGPTGSLLAGMVYLLWLAPLQGFGGQSPIFYNLLIGLAAMIAFGALPRLHRGEAPAGIIAAMLLAGAAITVKTTALFEATFLGLYCLITLARSNATTSRKATAFALWIAAGAAPAAAIAASYALSGNWAEYSFAMVTSNLAKTRYWDAALENALRVGILMTPLAIMAVLGMRGLHRDTRQFLALWIGAATVGLMAVPNFFNHYALPLTVPLCVAAAGFLARPGIGLLYTALIAITSFWLIPIFEFDRTARSIAAMDDLADTTQRHLGDRSLFVYDGPPQLYRLVGQPFATPLAFPDHLANLIEKDASYLSPLPETERVLATRPGAVVMAARPTNPPVNWATRRLVLAYVGRNCRLDSVIPIHERLQTNFIAVWGDCRT